MAKMTAKKGLTAAGDILGTVEYMAPEQMLGEIVDHRCDIYAAGVVLYQMLTKRLPFQGKDAVAILYKIMNEDPAPPSYYNNQVGQELDQIVLKAISKTREERWETAEAFSIALESVLQNDRHPLVSLHSDNLDEFSTLSTEIDAGKNYKSKKKLHSVFIGRDREFKRLVNLFSNATRGQGQTVILKGEAGVGKSTLANRLHNYAEQQKSWVLYGTCLYQEGLAPYLPFDDALRGFFSNDNHSLLEKERNKLKNLVHEQTPLLQGLIEYSQTNSGPGRFTPAENSDLEHDSLFNALYQLISFISTLRPIILIIDDLHWADEASLRLFHYLSHQAAKKRILLLGISRIERYDLQKHGKPTMIVDLLARFGREGICEQITLYRLSRERCDRLIDKTLSSTLFTEEFYEFIYHETKGNPLFVLETLELMRENGAIFRKDSVWHNKRDEPEIVVPRHVEDVFTRRLNALNNEEREILQVAAVIGIKFDTAFLLHLLDISKITLLKSLQRVESELQIIVNTEQGFHFEHPMLREMLYNEISIALRQEYHLIIASELEKIYHGDFGARVGEMAGHLRQGGDHAKAAPLLYQAALRSFKLEAYREASRFVIDYMDSKARSGQSEAESISNAELYLILGRCHEETGRWDESAAAYKQLLHLSEKNSNPKGQIDALRCLGRIQVKLEDFETALDTYRRCLEIAKQQKFSKMFSHIYNNLGVIHRGKGNLDQALHYFKQTIKLVDNENGQRDKAHALNNIGIIANMRAD
ncbi:MAG: AAA family ATPase, partial [bacterium]